MIPPRMAEDTPGELRRSSDLDAVEFGSAL